MNEKTKPELYLVIFRNSLRDYPVVVYESKRKATNFIKRQPDSENFYIKEANFGQELD